MTFWTLGNSCYTCTPNTRHFIECICNLAQYHYIYVPVPYQNICIWIRLSWNPFQKHATHHHAMYVHFLFSWFLCLQSYNPRTYLWCHEVVYTLVLHLFCHGDLSTMLLTFSIHEFAMLVLQHYMCYVFMLTLTPIISSHAFC